MSRVTWALASDFKKGGINGNAAFVLEMYETGVLKQMQKKYKWDSVLLSCVSDKMGLTKKYVANRALFFFLRKYN